MIGRTRLLLAKNVRRLRVQRGWTQEFLSAKAKLGRNHIHEIEGYASNITLDTIGKIADALDVKPWQLLAEAQPGDQLELWRSK